MKMNLGVIFTAMSIVLHVSCGDLVLPNASEDPGTMPTAQDSQNQTKEPANDSEHKKPTEEMPTMDDDSVAADDKAKNDPAQNEQSPESLFEMSIVGKWSQCDLMNYENTVSRLWVLTVNAATKSMTFKYTDFEGGDCKGVVIGSDTLNFSYSLKKESDTTYQLDLALANITIYTRITKTDDSLLISLGSLKNPYNTGDTPETRCDIDDQMIGFTMTRVSNAK